MKIEIIAALAILALIAICAVAIIADSNTKCPEGKTKIYTDNGIFCAVGEWAK